MKKSKGIPTPKRELRTFTASQPLTVRTAKDGSRQLKGYAIVFNSKSVDLGGFREVCSPDMLTRTLKENPDVLLIRDHKQELLLGRTTAGTLDLKVDSTGLGFVVTLPKTQTGDDTAENVRLGNLTGCSFAFNVVDDSWDQDADGNVVRTLLDVDLFEISITSFPAYADTVASLRSCPASLRSKLRKKKDDVDEIIFEDSDDSDDPEDDDDDEERSCGCDCSQCLDGACDACDDDECDDGDCDGCPSQDEYRADILRTRSVFQRLMT